MAGEILTAMAIQKVPYDRDRAMKPEGLDMEEMANYLLIANALEGRIPTTRICLIGCPSNRSTTS